MTPKLERAAALGGRGWALLIRAWLLLLLADLGLRRLSFHTVQRLLVRPVNGAPPADAWEQGRIRQAEQMVDLAARHHLYSMSCLRRALALQSVLAGWDLATELHFGVRKTGEQLEAHAWLTYQGRPLGEPGMSVNGYSPLTSSDTRL